LAKASDRTLPGSAGQFQSTQGLWWRIRGSQAINEDAGELFGPDAGAADYGSAKESRARARGAPQIRFAPLWRKTSSSTHRTAVSRFGRRILTARARLRQHVVDYHAHAQQAVLGSERAASILPSVVLVQRVRQPSL
jgi:hypothetical protein